MTDQPRRIEGGRRPVGDIAPKLGELTDDVFYAARPKAMTAATVARDVFGT